MTWIERCRRLSGSGPEHVHVGNVELVDQIEHIHGAIEFESLGQIDRAADAKVGEDGRRLDAGVALQIAV